MNDVRPLPSKEELMVYLTKLNEVTLEINDLMNQLGGAKTQDEVAIIRQSITQKTEQQSEIIEHFMQLSLDHEKVNQFKEIVQAITRDAQRLEALTSNEEILELQGVITAKVDQWSNLLEVIIGGVMSRV